MASIPPRHTFTFTREERLKSRSVIDKLFLSRQFVSYGGIRLYWIFAEPGSPQGQTTQYGFAVSKKNFPRAVDRNRIKRLMREAVRLQKAEWSFKLPVAFMWVYSGREIPVFDKVLLTVKKVKEKWVEKHPSSSSF